MSTELSPTAVINRSDGKVFVLWKGTDGNLWEAQGKPNQPLDGPFNRGMGPLGSAPTVAIDRSGATFAYWKGTDDNLWEGFWDGSKWVGPFNRNMGPLGSAPTAVIDRSD